MVKCNWLSPIAAAGPRDTSIRSIGTGGLKQSSIDMYNNDVGKRFMK
jgi:hypothetical protein